MARAVVWITKSKPNEVVLIWRGKITVPVDVQPQVAAHDTHSYFDDVAPPFYSRLVPEGRRIREHPAKLQRRATND